MVEPTGVCRPEAGAGCPTCDTPHKTSQNKQLRLLQQLCNYSGHIRNSSQGEARGKQYLTLGLCS